MHPQRVPFEQIPIGREWWYEAANYGVAVVARVLDSVELHSANDDYTKRFPIIAAGMQDAFPGQQVITAGVVVASGEDGIPRLDLVQRTNRDARYIISDILHAEGEPQIDMPFQVRRLKLEELMDIETARPEILLAPLYDTPDLLFEGAHEAHYKGIVAKNRNSTFRPGTDTKSWREYIFPDFPTSFMKH